MTKKIKIILALFLVIILLPEISSAYDVMVGTCKVSCSPSYICGSGSSKWWPDWMGNRWASDCGGVCGSDGCNPYHDSCTAGCYAGAYCTNQGIHSPVPPPRCDYISGYSDWTTCSEGRSYGSGPIWTNQEAPCPGNASSVQSCCPTPAKSLDVNGLELDDVNQETEEFSLNWNFSIESFYLNNYSCSIESPTSVGFSDTQGPSKIVKPVGVLTPVLGTEKYRILTLASPSTPATQNTYTLRCVKSGLKMEACPSPVTDTARVTVTALPFELDRPGQAGATADPNPAEIGDPVIWTAHPRGGYPPYIYTWTGDVTGNTKSLSKRFSEVGTKSATVRVRENGGTTKEASASTVIQNTRTSQ